MNRHLSKNVQNLRPSGIRRYFDIAASCDDVVTLGIGEPDFVTPAHILEAGVQSLRAGETGYTSNAGTAELRAAIAAHIERRYGLIYASEDEVLVTVGVSEALFLALKTVLDAGDEVLVVEPCFVANPALVEMTGGVPVPVPTSAKDGFQVTGAALEARISPRSKAILLSYPNNPTGAVLSRERLLQVAEVARKHDLVVISDEIYERLVYGGQHINFATLPGMRERTIVLSGMSKSYAMTGWRIGYITAPHPFTQAMYKLHQYLIMSAPTMGQAAALQAIQHGEDDIEAMRRRYDQRRRLLVDGFNSLGLRCFEPRGAFYAFPSIAITGMDDEAFCEALLEEARLALIPGSAFGASGTGYVRASYATSEANIREALTRLERFLSARSLLPQRTAPALVA
ncbi:MAG: aminotransferase class I/II-fold pyridoxal phosphate-dependent enzyme [Chloroflexi bacterium]|nr:aminotransferase class I/II-fold pyridoxal phosphate-dependent enzyme [Chloroflexota bacterium]MCY3581291.1 aminotransferase class I/II-fold pyridoxal phosphate-dependent enzyme [Chloroflexota bacterium]MCY3716719.1 aminotransferase class I/II-fold pyridoxal phosphate-dependent enzyme [Chloroflexota bacterium]MDE2649333.1 aminotransferase class I/II-fold pyridoxal phosphate-dependent enzyme [Chloroflexota bacterium]MXX49690.1 aminotransferase class I/II-fold pyridoxal phosphate-dependent enz